MEIKIPDINGKENYIKDKKSIVLIGSNGSGKTRMSVWIDEHNPDINIHRISAQKSLDLPEMVSPTEMNLAEDVFLYGTTSDNKEWLKIDGKKSGRWGSKPETYMLNDYHLLMQYLMTENYEKSIEYRENHKVGNNRFDNVTRLEKIKVIWENVITHRKLKICAGKIEISNEKAEEYYNGSEMSDGERAIFYYIGEVLCAEENSLIIIDEPENHLHKSILSRLWDAVEDSRPDCTFLYITHNLDFANSRINPQIIWIQELLSKDSWKYELVDNTEDFDDLKLEIMGSRQKVLLVEGTPLKSVDRKLYSKIYGQYNIIPMESCNTVIQISKSYNRTRNLHYTEVKGIIDRDRRSENEISKLKDNNIFVPKVAEVENLFLLPEVIRAVAKKQDKENFEDMIEEVQNKTLEFLQNNMREQALLFTKQNCQNIIYSRLNAPASTVDEYKNNLSNLISMTDIQDIYDEAMDALQTIVNNNDYLEALKVINNKGLLPYTQLTNKFGWKKDYYIDYILSLLDKDDKIGRLLKDAFTEYVPIL